MTDRQAKELARENERLRGDLLTISTRISHDLRAPLGSILNTAELLREVLAEKDVPAATLDPIFQSIDELMRLIKAVSLLEKATAGPAVLKRFNMSDAVYRAWQRSERQIVRLGARVEIADSWPEVDGVVEWLEVVWHQFLSNALRHGGRTIVMGWQPKGATGKFFVSDDGPGVPSERRAKLFPAFHELHHPGAAAGLGLSMARRLVELQHGGCAYEFDHGSIFSFTLPLEPLLPDQVAAAKIQEVPA